MKHFFHTLYQTTCTKTTKIMFQTILNFVDREQILYQRGNFSALQVVGLVSKRLEPLEEKRFPSLALRQSESSFQLLNHSQKVLKLKGQSNVYARSKNSIYVQVKILRVNVLVVQIGHLINTCVHVLCAYTWVYFKPHSMCSFWFLWFVVTTRVFGGAMCTISIKKFSFFVPYWNFRHMTFSFDLLQSWKLISDFWFVEI